MNTYREDRLRQLFAESGISAPGGGDSFDEDLTLDIIRIARFCGVPAERAITIVRTSRNGIDSSHA